MHVIINYSLRKHIRDRVIIIICKVIRTKAGLSGWFVKKIICTRFVCFWRIFCFFFWSYLSLYSVCFWHQTTGDVNIYFKRFRISFRWRFVNQKSRLIQNNYKDLYNRIRKSEHQLIKYLKSSSNINLLLTSNIKLALYRINFVHLIIITLSSSIKSLNMTIFV